MVVHVHIARQRLPHVLGAVETVGLEDIRNAAIETLHHAIGFGRSGFGQSVLNTQRLAQLVKCVLPAGFTLFAGKQAVSELLAVVRQQLLDLDRTRLVQGLQEAAGTTSGFVGIDLHKHPAGGPVDGHKQVAALALVGHLRQILHVHVHVARLIGLEALVRLFGRGGQQRFQAAYTMATQAPVQARARDILADKFAHDRQQVIQGQQQGLAQFYGNELLLSREGGLESVCRVTLVGEDLTLFPFVDGADAHAIALGQDASGLRAGGNLLTNGRCGSRPFVQLDVHVAPFPDALS